MNAPPVRYRVLGWLAGLGTAATAFAALWLFSFPALPSRIEFDAIFPAGIPGTCEPLLTSGANRDGDFLAVRYVDADRAVLLYDVWGVGGPVSAPFALRPGERRRVTVEMPTLAPVDRVRSRERRPLRVTVDGTVLLDEPVFFHRRRADQLYFARNPIGGTLVAPAFRGTLAAPGGRPLAGGPAAWFSPGARLSWIARAHLLGVFGALLAAAGVGLSVARLGPRVVAFFRDATPAAFPPLSVPAHRAFAVTAALCVLVFSTVITGGTFRFFERETFGDQYDYQAQSLLAGRLDLPEAARTEESFVFEGRLYMYFGPTPALLRLPFVAAGVAVHALSRPTMVVLYAALLAAVYALLRHAARLAGGPDQTPSRDAVVLFTAVAGLGTTLLYLAGRAYTYHEAILCGATFALWSGWFSLRYLAAPAGRAWLGAALCGLFAVHARPPAGLFALTLLGCVALAVAVRGWLSRRPSDAPLVALWRAGRGPLVPALVAVAFVLSFNALSYLKFRTFDGAPLKYHVQYDALRVAAIDGRNFHPENFRHNFDAYFWRPALAWRPGFPFLVHGPAPAETTYPRARIDLAEPTLALPYAMPALCLLAVVGGLFALVHWPAARGPLALVALAALPMALALCTAVAISHRYTADFCPPLLLAGAYGLQSLGLLPPARRRTALGLLAVAAAVSAGITLALALRFQGELVWGVSDAVRANYQMLRQAVDSALGLPRS